ncbi:MAG: 30S ribosome-binding factor RbfA [Candidatus Nealsonbacteria bacterium]
MSDRIKRINELLKNEIGQILLREVDLSDVLLTITRVDASPNLQEAKVYVSTIPDREIDRIFIDLNKQVYSIQQDLNKRLNMRPVPKIKFRKEEMTKQAGKVEEILKKIKE